MVHWSITTLRSDVQNKTSGELLISFLVLKTKTRMLNQMNRRIFWSTAGAFTSTRLMVFHQLGDDALGQLDA
ncbi:unnamed protein product [Amoebophrya sp. A25]|nr:unnamed protein product [Amoebophrya sp. A25]|eukprot:GSA25T00005303001.1